MTLLWTCVGYCFASYTVIANDTIKTLGTWIKSNKEKFEYKDGFTYLDIISGVVEVLENKVTILTD